MSVDKSTDMVKIVEASYAIWRKDKLQGARVAYKVPQVIHTWQLRWRDDFKKYTETLIREARRNRPPVE